MTETWLRPNRRALAFGLIPPLAIAAIGLRLAWNGESLAMGWVLWLGAAMLIAGLGITGLLLWQMFSPRIAYGDGHVLFRLQSGPPIAVPVDIVEAFFVGQQPLDLPARERRHNTVTLVARLSQRAAEWQSREVRPALGRWKEGYVVTNGTWCEPINGELIRRLNHRLREIHEQNQATSLSRRAALSIDSNLMPNIRLWRHVNQSTTLLAVPPKTLSEIPPDVRIFLTMAT
jgi:hypothetical protein